MKSRGSLASRASGYGLYIVPGVSGTPRFSVLALNTGLTRATRPLTSVPLAKPTKFDQYDTMSRP